MTITHPAASLATGIRTVIGAARWIGVVHPSSADGSPDIAVELGELQAAVIAVSEAEGAPDGLRRDLQRLVDLAGWIPFWSHETGKRRQWRALVEDVLPAWLQLFIGLSVRPHVSAAVGVNGEACFPGTTELIPPLLTPSETVRVLRLDVLTTADGSQKPRTLPDALKSLDHLARIGRLSPLRLSKSRTFARGDVLGLLDHDTRPD